MKLKKLQKIFGGWETIRVWGKDENTPVWEGIIDDIPKKLAEKKLIKGPDGVVIDIRYDCADIEDHIAVFINEK